MSTNRLDLMRLTPDETGAARTLHDFCAYQRFNGRTFEITVWATDWADAESYCADHGLKLMGKNL